MESAAAARRAVARVAAEGRLSDQVVHDGTLAASELVTNAVLHARTSIHLSVACVGGGVRIEVEDGSPYLPPVDAVRPEDLVLNQSMTGRGLALVAATSDEWGAEPIPGGKVTWAEVGTGRRRRPAGTRRPAANGRHEDRPGRGVRLTGVPVALILESTRQLSDLQREVQVMAMARDVPEVMVPVVESASHWLPDIDSWTDADRLAAQAAAAAGLATVDFDVFVPDDIARRIEGIAAWLHRAASATLQVRLLTLPASPEVVAYRRWYAEEIMRQLAGGRPRRCPLPVPPAG